MLDFSLQWKSTYLTRASASQKSFLLWRASGVFSCLHADFPQSKAIPVLSSWGTFFSALHCGWSASPSRSWSRAGGREVSPVLEVTVVVCTHQWQASLSNSSVTLLTHAHFVIHHNSPVAFFVSAAVLCPVFEHFVILTYMNILHEWTGPHFSRSPLWCVTSYSDSRAILQCVYRLPSWAWFCLWMQTNPLLSLLPHHSWKYWTLLDLELTSVIPTWYNPTILTPTHW